MTDNRLPLDDPEWSQLETFAKASEPLNILIRNVLNDPFDPANPALDELVLNVFHQYSLVEASYAVFPYLVEISQRYEDTNPRIYYLAANIAASALDDQTVVSERVRRGYAEALLQFERTACTRLTTPSGFSYGEIVAALAFVRHCAARLLMDALEREGTKRTDTECAKCGEVIEVGVLDEGTVILVDSDYPPPPNPPMPLPLPTATTYPQRAYNPWTAVADFLTNKLQNLDPTSVERKHVDVAIQLCRSGVTPQMRMEHVASLIGSVLLAHGIRDSARRFYRFWDHVSCPKCRETFMLAHGWWGCHCGGSIEQRIRERRSVESSLGPTITEQIK